MWGRKMRKHAVSREGNAGRGMSINKRRQKMKRQIRKVKRRAAEK